ncbi:hypothetical protein HII31_04666 [Pseudocercospora fuligena]|uniref:Apple domain-containing protein n=1 Tax=Pseudocercospora fuligena TaxID=685502 RepID=A0A8H6RMY7_9PEZI|nr:hypothetical protein HII31_04666 [Pseudocercospora fuligena]
MSTYILGCGIDTLLGGQNFGGSTWKDCFQLCSSGSVRPDVGGTCISFTFTGTCYLKFAGGGSTAYTDDYFQSPNPAVVAAIMVNYYNGANTTPLPASTSRFCSATPSPFSTTVTSTTQTTTTSTTTTTPTYVYTPPPPCPTGTAEEVCGGGAPQASNTTCATDGGTAFNVTCGVKFVGEEISDDDAVLPTPWNTQPFVPPSSTPAPGRRVKERELFDRSINFLELVQKVPGIWKRVLLPDIDTCTQACANTPGCVGTNYQNYNCTLLSSITGTEPAPGGVTIEQVPYPEPPPDYVPPVTTTTTTSSSSSVASGPAVATATGQPNFSCPANDGQIVQDNCGVNYLIGCGNDTFPSGTGPFGASSFNACFEMCSSGIHGNCVAFTYVIAQSNCWLSVNVGNAYFQGGGLGLTNAAVNIDYYNGAYGSNPVVSSTSRFCVTGFPTTTTSTTTTSTTITSTTVTTTTTSTLASGSSTDASVTSTPSSTDSSSIASASSSLSSISSSASSTSSEASSSGSSVFSSLSSSASSASSSLSSAESSSASSASSSSSSSVSSALSSLSSSFSSVSSSEASVTGSETSALTSTSAEETASTSLTEDISMTTTSLPSSSTPIVTEPTTSPTPGSSSDMISSVVSTSIPGNLSITVTPVPSTSDVITSPVTSLPSSSVPEGGSSSPPVSQPSSPSGYSDSSMPIGTVTPPTSAPSGSSTPSVSPPISSGNESVPGSSSGVGTSTPVIPGSSSSVVIPPGSSTPSVGPTISGSVTPSSGVPSGSGSVTPSSIPSGSGSVGPSSISSGSGSVSPPVSSGSAGVSTSATGSASNVPTSGVTSPSGSGSVVPTGSSSGVVTSASSSTVPSAAVSICPALDNGGYDAPSGGYYEVQCDTSISGTRLNTTSLKARQAPSNAAAASCLAQCDLYTRCLAVNVGPSGCELLSSIGSTSASPGTIALLKAERPANTGVVTVTVCRASGTRTTTVFSTATVTTCPAGRTCPTSSARVAARDL